MGRGGKYKCISCGQEYEIYLGIGFLSEMRLYICSKCNRWHNISYSAYMNETEDSCSKVNYCQKCKIKMKRYNKEELPKLYCNNCGNKLEIQNLFLWD